MSDARLSLEKLFAERVMGWEPCKNLRTPGLVFMTGENEPVDAVDLGFTSSVDEVLRGVEAVGAQLLIDSYPTEGGGRGQIVQVNHWNDGRMIAERQPQHYDELALGIAVTLLLALGESRDVVLPLAKEACS